MSASQPWTWKQGESFPRFRLCRGCHIYTCEQWVTWSTRCPECSKLMIQVLAGHHPPENFDPALGTLEMLAAVAHEWEKET